MGRLTDKQRVFCEEYLEDLNATQAAIRAGYSKKTARQAGSENLSKPDIQCHVQKLMDERSKRTQVTVDRVLQELALIGFLDIRKAFDENGHLIPIQDMPEEVARAIGGIDVSTLRGSDDDVVMETTSKIKLIDKKGSLELMGRHLEMFVDRTKHDLPEDLEITVKHV